MKRLLESLLMVAADMGGVVASFFIAYSIRHLLATKVLAFLPPNLAFEVFLERWYIFLFWLVAFLYEGLYFRRFSFWEEVKRLWRGAVAATVLTLAVLFVAQEPRYLSRMVLLLAAPVSFAVLPASRALVRRLLGKLWRREAVLIASPQDAGRLKKLIERDRALGYRIKHVLYRWEPKAELAEAVFVQQKLFNGEHELGAFVKELERRGVREVFLAPSLASLSLANVSLVQIESYLFLKTDPGLLAPWRLALKEVVDYSLGLLMLLVALPLMPIIWLLVKIDSPGPGIYKSERVGKGGRRFFCYKFRTMYVDADQRLERYLREHPEAREEWERYHKLSYDPRVTRLGKFLRKTSLDELPQVFNVLKGEMSMVGPRPYLIREEPKMGEFKETILRVKPGITGLWQVSGRSDLDFNQRLVIDALYVRSWSLWLDFVILLKTVRAVLLGEGAY